MGPKRCLGAIDASLRRAAGGKIIEGDPHRGEHQGAASGVGVVVVIAALVRDLVPAPDEREQLLLQLANVQ